MLSVSLNKICHCWCVLLCLLSAPKNGDVCCFYCIHGKICFVLSLYFNKIDQLDQAWHLHGQLCLRGFGFITGTIPENCCTDTYFLKMNRVKIIRSIDILQVDSLSLEAWNRHIQWKVYRSEDVCGIFLYHWHLEKHKVLNVKKVLGLEV